MKPRWSQSLFSSYQDQRTWTPNFKKPLRSLIYIQEGFCTGGILTLYSASMELQQDCKHYYSKKEKPQVSKVRTVVFFMTLWCFFLCTLSLRVWYHKMLRLHGFLVTEAIDQGTHRCSSAEFLSCSCCPYNNMLYGDLHRTADKLTSLPEGWNKVSLKSYMTTSALLH